MPYDLNSMAKSLSSGQQLPNKKQWEILVAEWQNRCLAVEQNLHKAEYLNKQLRRECDTLKSDERQLRKNMDVINAKYIQTCQDGNKQLERIVDQFMAAVNTEAARHRSEIIELKAELESVKAQREQVKAEFHQACQLLRNITQKYLK